MFKKIDPKLDIVKEEEKVLKFWDENKIFKKTLEKNKDKEKFIFFEGPPTANGKLGIHHVLARVFKDAIPRYKTMKGYNVPRKAGWDTQGLPVELEVEKHLGISGKDQIENLVEGDRVASIKKFNDQCRESVWKYTKEWEDVTKRIFYWLDMEKPYATHDKKYIESLWWIVNEAYKQDLLYKGHKVVPHCSRCGTALSSHEVAQGYKDVTEKSVYIKFNTIGSNNEKLLAWTTTPWTLPGNVGLAVGEDVDYVKVKQGEEILILAKSRLEILNDKYEVIEKMKGKDLEGIEYEPLFDVEGGENEISHKVILADFVTTEDGTGIVHTAVMYGEDDYLLGDKVGLPKNHTVGEDGKFLSNVEKWAGVFVKKAEPEIIADLKERNLLYKDEYYTHSYPHCWRCGSPLLYYARDSWYFAMSKLKDKLLKNNEKINWIPSHLKKGRFGDWLENVNDWAISRSRYWGTPLPIWECSEKKQDIKNPTLPRLRGAGKIQTSCDNFIVIQSYEELAKLSGKEINIESFDPHRPYIDDIEIKCDKCGGKMNRVEEVMDCWFDSGSMPYAQNHYPFENKDLIKADFPADYISEAIDQTRGWFYSLLAVSTIVQDDTSYKNVISLGHIMDDKGHKMSKSVGNIIDPMDVINKFGADPLRYFFYTINQPGDTKNYSEKGMLTVTRNVFLTLWNVYSFFSTYASLDKFEPSDDIKYSNPLDRWVISKKNSLIKTVVEGLDSYDIYNPTIAIEKFINELSTWYVRRSRSRFWKSENDSDKNDAFNALYEVLVDLSKLMAPFTPAFSEMIYTGLKSDNDPESVHLCDYPEAGSIDKEIMQSMDRLKEIVEQGHAERSTLQIKLRQPLKKAEYVGESLGDELEAILLEELNVKEVEAVKKLNFETKVENSFVAFDPDISDELKAEGTARELIRMIQGMRKKAEFQVEDRITLNYETSDNIKKVFEDKSEMIKKEILATNINAIKSDCEFEKELEIGEDKVWIGISRIK